MKNIFSYPVGINTNKQESIKHWNVICLCVGVYMCVQHCKVAAITIILYLGIYNKKKNTVLRWRPIIHEGALCISPALFVVCVNLPVSQYERPRAVALASSACVDKTTKIITEFTRKDPFLRLKRVN